MRCVLVELIIYLTTQASTVLLPLSSLLYLL
jgi:hypothetical protein